MSFKLSIRDVTKYGAYDYDSCKNWNKRRSKRCEPVKVRAYIYQCRDLPAADKDGTSDPYVEIWDTSDHRKYTDTITDTTNPLFYQVVEFDYEVEKMRDLTTFPPFILDVYDYDDDLFDKEPDFLCRAIIPPTECSLVTQD